LLSNFVANQFSHGDLNQIELSNCYRYFEWFEMEEYLGYYIAIHCEETRYKFNQYLFAGKARARSGANASARLMWPSLLQ